jgi:hypothetical protein
MKNLSSSSVGEVLRYLYALGFLAPGVGSGLHFSDVSGVEWGAAFIIDQYVFVTLHN